MPGYGHYFGYDPRDPGFPKTEAAIQYIGLSISYIIMMGQIILVEIPHGDHKKTRPSGASDD